MHSTIAAMYPRMRTGIFFTPNAEGDGVLLTNGSEVVSFLGASTYAWLERLSPHLNGAHSVADLTASLPPAPRQMVEKLVGALHEAGLVRDVSQDQAHSLTQDELDAYASEIAFVESFATSPALRFQRYRETRTVVIGAGTVFASAVEGALLTGVARLTARPVRQGPQDQALLDRLSGLEADARDRDPGQRLETEPLDPSDPVALRDAVAAAGLVLYAADHSDTALLRSLDRICAELGTAFVPVTLCSDEAWVGPVCAADRPATRWESLGLRLGDRLDDGAQGSGFLTGPVPGIVANHLVFRAFEHLTGVAGSVADGEERERPAAGVVRLDLESLQTSVHELTPHPGVPGTSAGSGSPRSARERGAGAAVEAAELAARVVPLTDARLGLLGPVSEAHYEQFPLRVVRVSVTDPARPDRPFAVWGAGTDFPQAQDAALRHALASHAVRSPGAAADNGAVTGTVLSTGADRAVPAEAVFGEPADAADADVSPAGTAAGRTWAAAVEQGLLDHVLRTARRGAAHGPEDRRRPAELELTAASRRFLDLLDASGEELGAFCVDTPPGVHAYAFQLGTGTGTGTGLLVEYGAGITAAEAVEAGLGRLLLAWQAKNAGQPEYAPSPAVNLQIPSGADGPPDTVRWGPLVAALRAGGSEAVAVPLDADPAVRAALPHLVRVVLLDV
ncbi:hypothetical protein ACFV0B_14135 [Streptomyces xanthophaeus]|uniref:hypothetical protein n=1 Tax=Streptomyces xanthophaeus TaxID=67385 RepID=UPI0036BA953E